MLLNKKREAVNSDQKRRDGKEQLERRSKFSDWNYEAELSAFQARIGERFDQNLLRQAFVTIEYLQDSNSQRKELGIDPNVDSLKLPDDQDDSLTAGRNTLMASKDPEALFEEEGSNRKLVALGDELMQKTLSAYIRAVLPLLPEEGVAAVTSYLATDEVLAHVSFHIGTKDLILSREYPPSVSTMATTFRALVGALSQSEAIGGGEERAMGLVIDVVATQLHGKDITDIWDVQNPLDLITTILTNAGLPEPEPRLLWVSGQDTILSCYHIGIYCNKELIGQAPGETIEIAEDMAARDVMRRIFGYDESSLLLKSAAKMSTKEAFDGGSKSANLLLKFEKNPSVFQWSSKESLGKKLANK